MDQLPLLRDVEAEIISGADDAALKAAMVAFFKAGDQKRFLASHKVAAFTVLVLFTR